MNLRLAIGLLVVLTGFTVSAKDYVFTCLAPTPPASNANDWFNPQNWSPNGVPGMNDTATIGSESTNGNLTGFTVNLTAPVAVQGLTVVASTLTGNMLTVSGTLLVKVSSLFNTRITINGTMNVFPAMYAPVTGSQISCDVYNFGTVNLSRSAGLGFINRASVFQNNGPFTLADETTLTASVSGVQFYNANTIFAGNATIAGFGGASVFNNSGTVDVENGTLQLTGGSGAYVSSGHFHTGANGIISVQGGATLHGGLIDGAGATTFGNVTADGSVTVAGNAFFGGGWVETGTLEIAAGGVFTWQGGTMGSYTPGITGLVKIDAGGKLALNADGPMTLLQTVIDNHGSITWTNGGNLGLGNNATVTNESDGIFDAQCDALLGATSLGGINSIALFQNFGLFQKSAGATNDNTGIALPFNVSFGNVNADVGTIKFFGGSDGTFSSATFRGNQGVIEFSGGTHTNQLIDIYSGNTVADGAFLTAAAPNSKLLISGQFNLAGGAMGGLGTIKVASLGTLNWTSGTMTDAGQTTISPGGTLQIGNGGNVSLSDRSLINGGTITWLGAANILCSQSSGSVKQVIDNQAGAVFDIQNNSQLNGMPAFQNEGLLKKTGAGGTTSLICNVTNTGTIEVDSGILEMRANYADQATGPPAGVGKVVLNNGGEVQYDLAATLFGDYSGTGTLNAPGGIVNDGNLEFIIAEIEGNLDNQFNLNLGDAPGITTIHGNFTQEATGTLTAPLAGTNAATPDFGQLIVTGTATLAGTLQVTIENGFAPAPGAQFPIISAAHVVGTFPTLKIPAGISVNYSNTGVFLVVTGTVPVQIITSVSPVPGFSFGFSTISGRSYTVQSTVNLANPNWTLFTNFTGDGSFRQFAPATTNAFGFFRVSEP